LRRRDRRAGIVQFLYLDLGDVDAQIGAPIGL
jgi:hypothetical protein